METTSLEGLPTKAKEDPSPHEMRLFPTGHQPSISWSRGDYYYYIIIIIIIIIIVLLSFLYLNLVKILKYIKFTYRFTLIKGQAWFLQYKLALFTPNLEND